MLSSQVLIKERPEEEGENLENCIRRKEIVYIFKSHFATKLRCIVKLIELRVPFCCVEIYIHF